MPRIVCIMITLVREEKWGKELVIRLWMWQQGKESEWKSEPRRRYDSAREWPRQQGGPQRVSSLNKHQY